jgi:hypothetical protein
MTPSTGRPATDPAAAEPQADADKGRRDAKPDGRDETVTEMADRNFSELLQELRVAQTGVQILFAFLLSLPFTDHFDRLGLGHKAVYLFALGCTTLATACLLAPVNHHRILFRRGRKTQLVELGNRLARIGMWFLLLAIVAAAGLIAAVVVNRYAGLVVAALLFIVYVVVWFLHPLWSAKQPPRTGPGTP